MNIVRLLLTALIVGFTIPVAAGPWSAGDDFGVANNPNGAWSYGYYILPPALNVDISSDPHTLQLFSVSSAGASYGSWGLDPSISSVNATFLNATRSLVLTAGYSPLLAFYAPVVRWTAPADGDYELESELSYSGLGGGVTSYSQAGLRTADGVQAFHYIADGNGDFHFHRTFALQAGQHLDFFVARGLQSVALDASINLIPEPGSLALALAALLFAYERRLTRRSS